MLYKLAWLANIDAFEQTIRQALQSISYLYCVAVLKLFLSNKAIAKLFACARTYALFTLADWGLAMYIIESAMQWGGPSWL